MDMQGAWKLNQITTHWRVEAAKASDIRSKTKAVPSCKAVP